MDLTADLTFCVNIFGFYESLGRLWKIPEARKLLADSTDITINVNPWNLKAAEELFSVLPERLKSRVLINISTLIEDWDDWFVQIGEFRCWSRGI